MGGSGLNCTDFGIFGIFNFFLYSIDKYAANTPKTTNPEAGFYM
jgi:uncharacterized membrane protein YsdA (DUF1294 family)